MSKVDVYGKEVCAHCVTAKSILTKRGIAFNYIDVGIDSAALSFIKELGFTTVPQIFVDGVHKGDSKVANTLEV